MKNIVIKNGILGGLIVSIVMISMAYYMTANPDNEPNAVIGFISMFLAFIFIFLGIKEQRAANNGFISFGKAFSTGLLISLIISVIYVIVWLIVYYNFFPDFMEKYSQIVLKNTKPEDLTAKTAEMNQMKEYYKSPIMITLLTFMEIFPFGLLLSLIFALILRKKTA